MWHRQYALEEELTVAFAVYNNPTFAASSTRLYNSKSFEEFVANSIFTVRSDQFGYGTKGPEGAKCLKGTKVQRYEVSRLRRCKGTKCPTSFVISTHW